MNRRARKPIASPRNKGVLDPNESSFQSSLINHSVGAVRTLYFHTGTHKTGSTALQTYLAANKPLLGESGISYAFAEGADQSTGNGQYFYDQTYERDLPEPQLDELVEFYLAGRTMAICSSEDFTRFKFQEWRKIKDVCQRLQVQAKFVTLVRDFGPYYLSLHGQLIKGGENYSTFEDFCQKDQYYPVLDSLKILLDVFGKDAMSVIHYESAIDHMDAAFMAVVGLPAEHFDRSPLERTVNRSLTEYEREILSHLNETTGRQYSLKLSDLLMRRRPNLRQVEHINSSIIELLTARHAVDVDWLNQTFFGGSQIIKINENARRREDQNTLSAEVRQAIDHDVANWCISILQSSQDESIKYITERLRSVDWKNASNPVIPDNFDPLAYLLLNPDVLKAGVPPYEHFITAGQHEKGRGWEWTSH